MSKINIMVMDQDDLGIYEIVIENDVGYEKRAVNLVPKGEPSPPHIISITYVTKSSALITWTRGFHGGFDQTVKVETSRDGTSWTPTLSLPQGTLEDTSPGGDNPGYNAAVTYEVVSSRKDTPDYDALQDGKEGNEDPHVYMPLEDSNPKSHAYYEYVNRGTSLVIVRSRFRIKISVLL
ncbi:hypothetical protein MAR_013511 [Mya arenaria]|uniref:Fibronectin type-III domain-containing protein n=1 Tax=Mya arenaria TaxID=6604 RepID=A0ABY7G3B5_MYAAR|nr:hypothetical protein MAR_013511 [Mya arenaria]